MLNPKSLSSRIDVHADIVCSWINRGSEIVFELYKKNSEHNYYASTDGWYLRVLWGGQPMQTSTPLGTLNMIPVENVLDCTSTLLADVDARFLCVTLMRGFSVV